MPGAVGLAQMELEAPTVTVLHGDQGPAGMLLHPDFRNPVEQPADFIFVLRQWRAQFAVP